MYRDGGNGGNSNLPVSPNAPVGGNDMDMNTPISNQGYDDYSQSKDMDTDMDMGLGTNDNDLGIVTGVAAGNLPVYLSANFVFTLRVSVHLLNGSIFLHIVWW